MANLVRKWSAFDKETHAHWAYSLNPRKYENRLQEILVSYRGFMPLDEPVAKHGMGSVAIGDDPGIDV